MMYFGWFSWILYVIAFFVLFFLAKSAWMFWREEVYKSKLNWALLEIKVPREVLKGPKAMEQFFAALFGLKNEAESFKEAWWNGEITRYHSFEIVGMNNEARFFIRTPKVLQKAVEGIFYAQYPEIEMVEVEDYWDKLPASYQEAFQQGYEIFGAEAKMEQSPAFPIKTYIQFEEETGDEKGRIVDPLAVLLEMIHNLKPEEMIFVQYIVQPDAKQHWHHDAAHQMKVLQATSRQSGVDDKGQPLVRFRFRTKDEEEAMEMIEGKMRRATFETSVRYFHMAPQKIFNVNIGYRGLRSYFWQFNNNRQQFDQNAPIMSRTEWYFWPFIFHKVRGYYRRVKLYQETRERFLPEETFAGKLYNSIIPWRFCFSHKMCILTSEELATLFHIPTNVVLTQSSMERIESKRLSPPSQLPS